MQGPGYLAVAIQPGAQTNVDEFHDWYNNEHGPLRLRLPFITSGDRYRAADDLRPEWSAVYDVQDLSWLDRRIYSRLREERSKREKRVMSTFESLDRKIYSLIATRGEHEGPSTTIVAVSTRIGNVNVDDFETWSDAKQVEAITKLAGWRRTRWFKMVVGGIQGMPSDGEIEVLTVHDFIGDAQHNDDTQINALVMRDWKQGFGSNIVSSEKRVWKHHLTLDALEEPPSSVVTTDGAELRFQLEGNPADPVVVFVNSILTNFHIWDDVARDLMTSTGGRTFRVLRYNSRGYSQQASKSNDSRFDLLADDLEYLLSRLGIDKVHAVVGVSMGGVTAINFAIRHPSMLDKFVACDCNVAASAANNTAWADRVELARSQGMSALADATVKRWFTPANHDSTNAVKTLKMVEQANLEGFVQNTGALCNYDLKDRLPSIQTPGLLIAGSGDGKLPDAMQNFGIANTRFVEIPDAGHLPMLENHKAYMHALERFL